jgi:5-methylcytosine-specific restriction protein A
MAIAPPRPCSHPGCGRFRCQNPAHQVAAWRTHDRPIVQRIRGRELQRRRAQLFARQPWCVVCLGEGRHTRATVRDHVVPLSEGGSEDVRNEQGLCQDCSDAKTRAESQRGVRRS